MPRKLCLVSQQNWPSGLRHGVKALLGGEDSPCFKILRSAGFTIIRKDEAQPSAQPALSDDDQEWTEGKTRLVAHLIKERAKGLSQAKKSQFKREHRTLHCEKCGIDPVAEYKLFSRKRASRFITTELKCGICRSSIALHWTPFNVFAQTATVSFIGY